MILEVYGTVPSGYGIASGKATDHPYPKGNISMQLQFFKKLGLGLGGFFHRTTDLDISLMEWRPL